MLTDRRCAMPSDGMNSALTARRMRSATSSAAVKVGACQEDAELLAAQAADQVACRGRCRGWHSAISCEHFVAALVAEAVVDALEVVGIDDQQRRAVASSPPSGIALTTRGEGAAVEAGGQPVGRCQRLELLVGWSQLLVLEHAGTEDHRAAQRHRHDDGKRQARHVQALAERHP